MRYRFEHKFSYKDSTLEKVNDMLTQFGVKGELSLVGKLGYTDVIIDVKPGQRIVPLNDEQNEKIRAIIEETLQEKLRAAGLAMTVTTSRGVLRA